MKKDKKLKDKNEEVVLGNKIRDIQVSEKQHFLLFVSCIVVFNVLLLASIWFVLIRLNNWYNWLWCIALFILSILFSFVTYRKIKNFNKCELFDNALSIKSIWIYIKIPLKNIYELKVKESILDKIFKINTKSLEIRIKNSRRKKFTMHFIEENALKLKQEITIYIDKDSENNNIKKTGD